MYSSLWYTLVEKMNQYPIQVLKFRQSWLSRAYVSSTCFLNLIWHSSAIKKRRGYLRQDKFDTYFQLGQGLFINSVNNFYKLLIARSFSHTFIQNRRIQNDLKFSGTVVGDLFGQSKWRVAKRKSKASSRSKFIIMRMEMSSQCHQRKSKRASHFL